MKKILLIIILIVVLTFTFIIVTINQNNKYYKNIENKIKKELNINELQLITEYNYNYICKTKNKVIVISDQYNIVYEDLLSNLAINNDGKLIYKNNTLMYEIKKQIKNKVIYTYYNANNNEYIKQIEIEGGIS